MTEEPARDRRRIDRVLAPSFLAGLADMPLTEVRSRRGAAEQEEVDLSYLRRLLQGRIDLVAAELARRSSTGGERGSIVHEIPEVFTDRSRESSGTRTRHVTMEPSQSDEHRRFIDQLIDDVDLSDPAARTDDELGRALEIYRQAERDVSDQRRSVQGVMDAASADIGRRYRDGLAEVGDVLAERDH